MKQSLFLHTFTNNTAANEYPDKLYQKAKELNPFGRENIDYEGTLKKVISWGEKAPYWVITAMLDLIKYYRSIKNDQESAMLEKVEALLGQVNLSEEDYGSFAYSLSELFRGKNNPQRTIYWLIEAVKVSNQKAFSSCDRLVGSDYNGKNHRGYSVDYDQKANNEYTAVAGFLMCYQPLAYFTWKKYIALKNNDSNDNRLCKAFTENVNPEAIIRNCFSTSGFNFNLVLDIINSHVIDNVLEPAILLDALNTAIDYLDKKPSNKKMLSDKDDIFYMKGCLLLQMKRRDDAKQVFKLINPFNKPLYAEVNFELGDYYMAEKNYSKSLNCFELALKNDEEGKVISLDTVNENISVLRGLLKIEDENSVSQSLNRQLKL